MTANNEALVQQIVRNVAELPDRTSPEDWPIYGGMMPNYKCGACGKAFADTAILSGMNPFSGGELFGCPHCDSVFGEPLHNICDEPGCDKDSSRGWNDDGVYRRTCYNHWQVDYPA